LGLRGIPRVVHRVYHLRSSALRPARGIRVGESRFHFSCGVEPIETCNTINEVKKTPFSNNRVWLRRRRPAVLPAAGNPSNGKAPEEKLRRRESVGLLEDDRLRARRVFFIFPMRRISGSSNAMLPSSEPIRIRPFRAGCAAAVLARHPVVVGSERLHVIGALESRRLGDGFLAQTAPHLPDRGIFALRHPTFGFFQDLARMG
jgi:hypothetical protein